MDTQARKTPALLDVVEAANRQGLIAVAYRRVTAAEHDHRYIVAGRIIGDDAARTAVIDVSTGAAEHYERIRGVRWNGRGYESRLEGHGRVSTAAIVGAALESRQAGELERDRAIAGVSA